MVVGTNQLIRLADGLIKELLSVNNRSLLKCDRAQLAFPIQIDTRSAKSYL